MPGGEPFPPGGRSPLARQLKAALVLLGLGVAGLGLAGCGSGAQAQAEQACSYVQKSLELLAKAESLQGRDPKASADYYARATAELGKGLQPATLAAASEGNFAPLATTISEGSRVPEFRLVKALEAECAAVGRGYLPPAPSRAAGRGVPPPGAP